MWDIKLRERAQDEDVATLVLSEPCGI